MDNIEAYALLSPELTPYRTDIEGLAARLERTDQDNEQRDWLAITRKIAAYRQNLQTRYAARCRIEVGQGGVMILTSWQACQLPLVEWFVCSCQDTRWPTSVATKPPT